MRVGGGDHQLSWQDAVFCQALCQTTSDISRHAAVIQHHHCNRRLVPDDHRARPKLGIDALVFRFTSTITGQDHGPLGCHVNFCHADRAQAFCLGGLS